MSLTVRRFVICALGILGGLAAWPFTEWVLAAQGSFASYLFLGGAQGAVLGVFLGMFLGSAEGITGKLPGRAFRGIAAGAGFGIAGGIAGTLAGQGLIFLAGNALTLSYRDLTRFGYPLARAVGWACMGLFVGAAEGARARSGRKIAMGAAGGLIGGLIGGAVLETLRTYFPGTPYVRGAGLVILGFSIAFFFALIERSLSFGYLMILNGPLKGKEYLVNQRNLRLGSGKRADIVLPGYTGIDPVHAAIRVRKGELELARIPDAHKVYVNDEAADARTLKYEDVIRIGTASIYYRA